MKSYGKLRYLNDIQKHYSEYINIFETKNVPIIDTSNVSIYQEEFYTMFPVISNRSDRDDLKRTNEKCLDLNEVLKYFAIINGYKFNNEEINKDMTEFRYTNQNHLKNSSLNAYNRFYDSTPLSVIFCLAKSEYQAWLTMFCLFKSMKSLSSYLIYNAYYYNRNKTRNSWTKGIFTHNIQFLYTGVFLPEYRNEAKRIYKSLIKEEKSLSKNDTQKNVQEYFEKTNQYVYKYEINHDIYQKIYLEMMYFIMINDYDFFSICVKALTTNEISAQIRKILNGEDYTEEYLFPLKSLIFYLKISKYKQKFCNIFLKHTNSDFAFKLLCILDEKYDEEIISKTFKAMGKSTYYIRDKLIYELAKKLKVDYPNNYELDLFISKKLALEIVDK